MLSHLYRKLNLFIARDPRAKWPKTIWDLEMVIYPYFLQAFEMKPEEYERAREILDLCLQDAYKALKGEKPKIPMGDAPDV